MTRLNPDVDAYIAGFPPEVQKILKKVRQTIRKAAPKLTEAIRYGIPTYVGHGNVVFFAGYKNHISVYPAPRANVQFKKELAAYKGGKGTVQFPLDQPIPYDLITRIVIVRLEEDAKRG